MRASAALRYRWTLPCHRHACREATLGSLLRQRLQTSFDGVTRDLPPEPSSSSALRHSRNGLVALFGWIAVVSYLEGPAAAQPHTCHLLGAPSSLIPALSAGSPNSARAFPTSRLASRPGSSTRRLHTSAAPKQHTIRRSKDTHTTQRHATLLSGMGSASVAATATVPSSATSIAGIGRPAAYGSIAHPSTQHGSWWERFGLSFLRASSSSHDELSSERTRKAANNEAEKKARKTPQGTGRIYDHIRHPSLYDPVVAPRHPIVLCHGLYGFDVRGPFFGLEIHYWANVLDILRKKVGADVLIHGVPPTGSIKERAEALHRFLCSEEAGVRGQKLNFIGHSMGGLDVRHLITNIKPKPEEYIPVSLTTVSTPHRGSPFMDWCNANIGIGNEYIEKALEEARATRANSALHSSRSEPVRLPYSLKTPLFSRPKTNKRTDPAVSKEADEARKPVSGTEATGVAAASAVMEAVDSAADAIGLSRERGDEATRQKVKESEERVASSVKESVKSPKGGSSLPFGLSSFAKALSSLSGSFSAYMLSLLDTPAYAMLSTKYMAEVFNPSTPNSPDVKYYSVAARTPSLAIWHPLWLPKLILDAAAESRTVGGESDGSADALGGQNQGNDGLVSVESAKWGEFLGIMEGCDHWDLRGGGAPRWKGKVNPTTGKPYQSKAEMTGQPEPAPSSVIATASDGSKASSNSDSSSTSWTDINQLLFSGQESKDGQTSATVGSSGETTKPSKFPRNYALLQGDAGWSGISLQDAEHDDSPSPPVERTRQHDEMEGRDDPVVSSFTPHTDDTLVSDIAAWISDRLPERNVERRAQAAERDRLISEMSLTLYQPVSCESSDSRPTAASFPPNGGAEWNGSDVAGLSTSASPITAAAAPAASTPVAGSAAGLATSAGSAAATRTGESSRPSRSAEDDASTTAPSSSPSNKDKDKAKPAPQPDELERFWVALCRHLHVEGF